MKLAQMPIRDESQRERLRFLGLLMSKLFRSNSEYVGGLFSAVRVNRGIFWRAAYFSVAVFLFVAAGWRRFALPQDPIAASDFGYLWPALMKLNGGSLGHIQGLNFIYPGMVYLILRTFSDFRAITVLQHCLGLVAGLLFLATWHRLGDFFLKPSLNRVAHEAIGLFGGGLYLLSNTSLAFEREIRSDAVCMFFEILTFWLIVQFFYRRLVSPTSGKAYNLGIGVVGSAALLASIKPSFTLMALILSATAIWLILAAKESVTRKAVFIGVAMIIPASLTLADRYIGRNDQAVKTFIPKTLFCIHAQIICSQMAAALRNCEAHQCSREWLGLVHDDLEKELQRAHDLFPGAFPILGFNPDYLMAGEGSLLSRWQRQLGEREFLKFLRYWFWHSLAEQPGAFVEKVFQQLTVFYSTDCPAFKTWKRYSLSSGRVYGRSFAAISHPEAIRLLSGTRAGADFAKRTQALRFSGVVLRQNRFAEKGHLRFAQSYLVVLIISVPVTCWFLCRKSGSASMKCAGFMVLLFYASNFGNVLGVSIVHSMEVPRYSAVLFISALFAELWAIRWMIEVGLTTFRGSKFEVRREPS